MLTVADGGVSTRSFYRGGVGNVVQNEVTEWGESDGPIAPGTTPLELTIEATYALE